MSTVLVTIIAWGPTDSSSKCRACVTSAPGPGTVGGLVARGDESVTGSAEMSQVEGFGDKVGFIWSVGDLLCLGL